MRLFTAIDLSDETRAELARVRAVLERSLTGVRQPPRVTWVAPEAAHVTVRFIGHVSDEIGERVRAALAAPIGIPSFDVEFGGIGTFPNSRRPRVVWIGARDGADRIAAVADAVNARLEPIVGAGEGRAFRAHLTVGRVKEAGRGVDWDRVLASAGARPTHSRIDHVTLYLSRVSSKGPTYTSVIAAPLEHG